jgi:hypothetical protein
MRALISHTQSCSFAVQVEECVLLATLNSFADSQRRPLTYQDPVNGTRTSVCITCGFAFPCSGNDNGGGDDEEDGEEGESSGASKGFIT